MLHLYRRHVPDCFFFGKARGAKGAKGCKTACPIWVQGSLRGEYIRRALNLTSWEAASDLVRQWEASGTIGVVKPDVRTVRQAVGKFFAEAEARRLSSSTISKQKNVLEKRLVPWCEQQGIRLLKNLTVDAVRQFRETWPDAPITASRNLERLRNFLKLCQRCRMDRAQSREIGPASESYACRHRTHGRNCRRNAGRLDVLVNNAGISGETAPVEDADPDQWEAVIALDVIGTFHVTRLSIPPSRHLQLAASSSCRR